MRSCLLQHVGTQPGIATDASNLLDDRPLDFGSR